MLLPKLGFSGVAYGSLCYLPGPFFASLQITHSSWAETEQTAHGAVMVPIATQVNRKSAGVSTPFAIADSQTSLAS